MQLFVKVVSVICTTLLLMFFVLPFVSGGVATPSDASANTIGTIIKQFIAYWSEVISVQ